MTNSGAGDLRSRDLFCLGKTRHVGWLRHDLNRQRGTGGTLRGRHAACISQGPGREQMAHSNRIVKENWGGAVLKEGLFTTVSAEFRTTARPGSETVGSYFHLGPVGSRGGSGYGTQIEWLHGKGFLATAVTLRREE